MTVAKCPILELFNAVQFVGYECIHLIQITSLRAKQFTGINVKESWLVVLRSTRFALRLVVSNWR